uniref:GRB2-associated and regulator of MAPK protein-like n=1 Tax=Phallusia mammillata TaxID=59560 RepID=A0A6F9DE62_9ASCI|nr:GRB2-associated and regulator of MAPK protein-like [Phallusia mammillata]
MDSIDNILAAGSGVQWTKQAVDINDIGQMYGFPQIVKVTAETSEKYGLPENEPVMLYGKRQLLRTVAQTIEEGHYVMGKQIEISNEFIGSFRISSDYERDEAPLKMFKSIQEVADYFPSKIYVQVAMTVSINDENVFLDHGDELTLVSRSDAQPVVGNPNKPASRFISKVRSRSPQHVALIVHNTRLNESLTLPLSLRGKFATRTPIEVAQAHRSRDMSLADLTSQVNYPITVVVTSNRTRSPKDEFVLRPGMHLKFLGVEDHDVVLAVTPFQRIIEFSANGDTFSLPASVVNPQGNEKDRNQYQTYLQSTYMATQLQSSVTNIDNYCKSVRFHVPRHLRPTNPTPLPAIANIRQPHLPNLTPKSNLPRKNPFGGVSAIELLTKPAESSTPRPSARGSSLSRRSLPTPNMLPARMDGPPLPPRNAAGTSPISPRRSLRTGGVPPVPPKARNRHSQAFPSDMPLRVAPVPHSEEAPSPPSSLPPTPIAKDTAIQQSSEQSKEEEIWDVWRPVEHRNEPSVEPQLNGEGIAGTSTEMNGVSSNEVSGEEHETPEDANSSPQPLPRARPESPSFELPISQIPVDDPQQTLDPIYASAGDVKEQKPPEVAKATGDDVSQLPSDHIFGSRDMLRIPRHIGMGELTVSSTDAVGSPDTLNGLAPFDDGSRSGLSEDIDLTSLRSKMSQKNYVPSPKGWEPPEQVATMSVEDVVHSLRFIGLSEDVVQYFYNERIDGQMLTELSDAILEEDFELGKLYRLKIRRFADGWRPKLDHCTAT